MTPVVTPLLTRTLPRTPTAAWEVREALDSLWLDVPPSILPVARLLASELVANAVRHGEGDDIRVSVLMRPGKLLVEVVDDGEGFILEDAPHDGPGGWGLRLVETLAQRWGVEGGKTRVWFELVAGE